MITFGTLLWIDESNHSAINNKNKSIVSYFRQVVLLAKTLRSVFESELVVFTNKPSIIEEWFVKNNYKLPRIIFIAPSIQVPAGFKFYGAHFKIDAMLAGAELLIGEEDRFFLIDTDVVANIKFDAEQYACIASADLIVYDISDQVFPAYGAGKIKSDIELVAGAKFTDPKWYGGEFLGGNKLGITRLVQQAKSLLPTYFSSANELHHVGDEMFVTSALNLLMAEGQLRIVNQVPYRMMTRHWSRHTDRSLAHHYQHSLVHCPGSKPALEFLSRFSNPSRLFIRLVLGGYQQAVLIYQSCKKLIK